MNPQQISAVLAAAGHREAAALVRAIGSQAPDANANNEPILALFEALSRREQATAEQLLGVSRPLTPDEAAEVAKAASQAGLDQPPTIQTGADRKTKAAARLRFDQATSEEPDV